MTQAQGSVTLDAADAYCQALLRHYENFTVASRLSRRALRLDLARVYAFCRTTDDIGDETGDATLAIARLERWREDTIAMFDGATPEHPALLALAQTVRRHRLPAQPFLDLIEANVQDQSVHEYEDWAALQGYCAHSAAPVGRIVLRLNRFDDPVRVELSDSVCIGLQLANFAQDVAVDARLGRTYLLQEELRRYGVERAVEAMCERARSLLERGRELEAMVDARLRVQLALYRLGGIAILDAVARCGFRTATIRPVVSAQARARIAAEALLTATSRRTRRRPQPVVTAEALRHG
jgi:squalene synthase HpnC